MTQDSQLRLRLAQEGQERGRRARNASSSKAAARHLTRYLRNTGWKSSKSRATKNQGSWIKRGLSPTLLFKQHSGGRAGDPYAQMKSLFSFSNMLSQTAQLRAEEFDLEVRRHPNSDPKTLFIHCSLSLPNGRKLNRRQWKSVVEGFLEEIGAAGCSFSAHVHSDKNEHVHIIFSRSLPNGRLLSISWSYYAYREAAARVSDQILGGRTTQREVDKEISVNSDLAVNANRRAKRRGTTPNHIDPETVLKAIANVKTIEALRSHLQTEGIELDITRHDDGTARGILFKKSLAEEWLAGSSINRQLSLPNIIKRIEENSKSTEHKNENSMSPGIRKHQSILHQPNRFRSTTNIRQRGI